MHKSEHLQIRVSRQEKNIIKESANAAGIDMSAWILQKVLNDNLKIFIDLIDKFSTEEHSFVFAALNDFLNNLKAVDFASATAIDPTTKLNDFNRNYIIAMIMQRANQLSIPAPYWINKHKILEKPYFGSSLKSLRLYLLLNSPPEFKSRNIFIDSAVGDRV